MTSLTVNNQPVAYQIDPQTPLLWALRDASNLTGTKYGCGTGHCGACTVDVDGRAVRSCRMTIAQAEGTFVTTIEGLSTGRDHPLQLAFLANNVVQCGFCVNGVIMSAKAYLDKNARASDADIRQALSGVLCRCGAHTRMMKAIRQYAQGGRR